MEIPCHFMSQIDGSLVQIDTMQEHGTDFRQVQVMEFLWHLLRKTMGFPSDLMSYSTKLSSKRHEKIGVTFFDRKTTSK